MNRRSHRRNQYSTPVPSSRRHQAQWGTPFPHLQAVPEQPFETPSHFGYERPSQSQSHHRTPFPSVLKTPAPTPAPLVTLDGFSSAMKTPYPQQGADTGKGTQKRQKKKRRFVGRDITNTAKRSNARAVVPSRGGGNSYKGTPLPMRMSTKTPFKTPFQTPRFVFDSVQKPSRQEPMQIRQDSPQFKFDFDEPIKKPRPPTQRRLELPSGGRHLGSRHQRVLRGQEQDEETKSAGTVPAWDEEPPEICPDDPSWEAPLVDEDTKQEVESAVEEICSYRRPSWAWNNKHRMSNPIYGLDDWEPDYEIEEIEEWQVDMGLREEMHGPYDESYFKEFFALGMPIPMLPVEDVPQLNIAFEENGDILIF